MRVFFGILIGFILGYNTNMLREMKTEILTNQEGEKVFTTRFNKENKTFVIRTENCFTGLKSKLYSNNTFVKDLQVRKLKKYPYELKKEMHNKSINQFLNK